MNPTPNAREETLQFFEYKHLPIALAEISRSFQEMAIILYDDLPDNPQRALALQKLLESKDAAVRAKIFVTHTVASLRPNG